MAHQNIPEAWADWILGVVGAAVAWIVQRTIGRVNRIERRVETLERMSAVVDSRHTANVERLDRIERQGERLEGKLDRLIERS